MNSLFHDLRNATRTLTRNPGFMVVAVLTLALGIGANTAIFSLVNAILLRPLPGADADRLVTIYTSDFSGPAFGADSYPDYLDIREQARDVFESATAYHPFSASFRANDRTELIFCELTSEDHFQALGVRLALGRGFRREESGPVAVLSHRFWTTRFQADPSAVGRSITINGNSFTIVGVAPERFGSPLRVLRIDAWIPAQWAVGVPGADPGIEERGDRGYLVLARLRPAITVAQAQARLDVLATQLHRAYPENWTNVRQEPRRFTVLTEADSRVPPDVRLPALGFLGLLSGVVALLFLIACANLANLLLAQAIRRRQEMAIRLALGAHRARLIRQLLTENVLVALCGGAAGIIVALFVTEALMLFQPPLPVPVQLDLSLDPRVFVYAFALSIIAGIVMGMAPAFYATQHQIPVSRFPRVTLRGTLVVTQTAASVLLLVAAGLLIRSLANAYTLPLGFDSTNLSLVEMNLELNGYSEARGRDLYRQMLERFPASALSQYPLLSLQAQSRRGISVQGYTRQPGEDMEFNFNVVSPGFLRLLGIRLSQGREFTSSDRSTVIVNRAFAQRFWPNETPLGKRLKFGSPESERPWLEVVGVAEDARFVSFSNPAIPFVLASLQDGYSSNMTLQVRGANLETIRRALLQLDPNLPITNAMTMTQNLGTALLPVRVAGTLIGAFGLLALGLAGIGLYGVLAHTVAQRTREIGIRMAVGAQARDILSLVMGQGLRLAGIGAATGLAAAVAATRVLAFLLYGVSPTDPLTFAGVALLLVAVALIAICAPARRAVRVNPMVALRYE